MPTTANFDFEYETPSTLPGITITGGPSGATPILAVQVDDALTGVRNTAEDNAANIAVIQTTLTGMSPIYGRVVLTGTQSLTNSSTVRINANTVEYQSASIWDAENFQFVIPDGGDGVYQLSASVSYDSNATGRRSCDISTDAARLSSELNSTDTAANVRYSTSTTDALVAGDVVWFTGFQTSGGALDVIGSDTNVTHLAIVRVCPLV